MRTSHPNSRHKRLGYTLVEVLIAVTITLTLLGFMMQAFIYASSQISRGRALMDMSNELRHSTESLRTDLASATVRMLPWSKVGSDEGYFSYKEGPATDFLAPTLPQLPWTDPTAVPGIESSTYGDIDDVIQFTARNLNEPYRGISPAFNSSGAQIADVVLESKVSEICWWIVYDPTNLDAKVYRRSMLIAPWLNVGANGIIVPQSLVNPGVPMSLLEFQQHYDISVRQGPGTTLIANNLADLTKRANRFGHTGDFVAADPILAGRQLTGARTGEDVILANVHAFDVRIFDPTVEVHGSPDSTALLPGDLNYGSVPAIGTGGFVDIGHGAPTGKFASSQLLHPNESNVNATVPHLLGSATFCTWSSHYEHDGIDSDGDSLVDEGTNGIDDNGVFGADDEFERETVPPYPYPLRGVQVRFRVREPATQQIRQQTVEKSFVPE